MDPDERGALMGTLTSSFSFVLNGIMLITKNPDPLKRICLLKCIHCFIKQFIFFFFFDL